MTKLKQLSLGLVVIAAFAFFAAQPAMVQAQTASGERNLVVWLGTATSAAESLMVGTGVNGARAGSVIGSVIIGSATSGNVLVTLYDSGNTSTTGKYVIGTFACASPFQFTLNQAVQYGLLLVNTGCKATLTYLTHK